MEEFVFSSYLIFVTCCTTPWFLSPPVTCFLRKKVTYDTTILLSSVETQDVASLQCLKNNLQSKADYPRIKIFHRVMELFIVQSFPLFSVEFLPFLSRHGLQPAVIINLSRSLKNRFRIYTVRKIKHPDIKIELERSSQSYSLPGF